MNRLMNPMSTVNDFVHYFEICRPGLLIADAELVEKARTALERVRGLEDTEIVVLGESDGSSSLGKILQVCLLSIIAEVSIC